MYTEFYCQRNFIISSQFFKTDNNLKNIMANYYLHSIKVNRKVQEEPQAEVAQMAWLLLCQIWNEFLKQLQNYSNLNEELRWLCN